MHLKNSDVFVALGIVLLNGVELLLPYNILWVSVLLALPLVFCVPGYMLTVILIRRLDIFQRLTLSLGLSLTLDILGGFLLNVLPMGLRTQSWVMLLSGLTLLFALVALYLRRDVVYREKDRQRTASLMGQGDRKGLPYMSVIWARVRDGIVFAVAATLVILSLLYATRGVAEGPHVGFTQLWMVPPSRTAPKCAVNVGIRSFENGSVTYHALVTMNGTQTMTWPALMLTPNQLWERSIVITPTVAKNIFVQVKLYRNDEPTVIYREVHMTLIVLISGRNRFYCGI